MSAWAIVALVVGAGLALYLGVIALYVFLEWWLFWRPQDRQRGGKR